MILEAVQINRYKDGLFVTSITPRTDLLNDLEILCNSNQVMGVDKMRLLNVKHACETLTRDTAAGKRFPLVNNGIEMSIYQLYGNKITELKVSYFTFSYL